MATLKLFGVEMFKTEDGPRKTKKKPICVSNIREHLKGNYVDNN